MHKKRFFRVLQCLWVAGLFLSFSPLSHAAALEIAPHRAVYDLSLDSVKNGSSLSDVTGTMTYSWGDACEAWTTEQKLVLHMTFGEGDESELDSTIMSWEAKDGRTYKFNVRRLTDQAETEVFKGRATKEAGGAGGVGKYILPHDKKDVPLAGDDTFPVAHTQRLIAEAKAGTQMVAARVFDGSDEAGLALVSTFIGAKKKSAELGGLDKKLEKNKLIQSEAWPLRMAFFVPEDHDGTPDYEMDVVMQENGVARSLRMDYGDFVVSGHLTRLEALPSGCQAKDFSQPNKK